MDINNLIETAEWLGEISDVAKLKRLKELNDNQKFYVTVWGHYSAGKSMLINNIFNRDILPVQTRETTAVLTYIQYGTQEECILIYEDGTTVAHNIEILKDIYQNTAKFEQVGKIDHIEVYLCEDILSSGLILVDTPGVNTVIQKHQDLAVDAIEQSGRIIYVLGNSPSNIDRQFIKQISECGVKISFVRTKCDRFNSNEEDPYSSLENEKKEIETFIGDLLDFIPVSNNKENIWNKNIQKVREMINVISNTISDEMHSVTNNRLKIFAMKYMSSLCDKEEKLKQVRIGNTDKADEEIRKCENDIKNLESIMEGIEAKIEKRVSEAEKESKKEIDELISNRIDAFIKELAQIEYSVNISEEVKMRYEYHLSNTIGRIQKLLNRYFEDIIQDETEIVANSVSIQAFSLPVPTYAEVQQENTRILEMYTARLMELKQAIEQTKEDLILNREAMNVAEAGFDERDYDAAIALLDEELAEIPSGMALRLAENQGVQPSSVFKTIGNIADVALLLIPGDAIVAGIKGVADTTKIAQALHKMGKVGEVIIKAGNTVGKNAKAIDRVRDTAYALNTVMGKRKYSTKAEKIAAEKLVNKAAKKGKDAFEKYKEDKKSGNVLDVLSVAYWTEKLGKQFDSEPKMEIDREEEDRRNQLRKQIALQQQQLSDERIRRKKELGLLQDKEAELKLKSQEEELKKKRIEEELRKHEQSIINQARVAACERYKQEYKLYYGECITNLAEDMISQYFKAANQNITMYVTSQSKEVIDAIAIKKVQLQDILSLRENGDKEIVVTIEKCNEFKMRLGMIGE